MLDINNSTLVETRYHGVASAVSKVEEGTPMIYIMENGKSVLSPATGAANEIFAGVAHNRFTVPNVATTTTTFTIPGVGPYTVTLPNTPVSAGDISVYIDGVVAPAGVPAAGEYLLAGAVLTFNAADAGKSVTVTYRYNITQSQAALLFGNDLVSPDLGSGASLAIIITGTVYIDNFDLSVDWSSANPDIKLGANGQVTIGGAGTSIPAIVESIPSASGGMLGLRLN